MGRGNHAVLTHPGTGDPVITMLGASPNTESLSVRINTQTQ